MADAHEELKQSIGAPPETGEHELDRTMSREPRTTRARGHAARARTSSCCGCPRASRSTASSGPSSTAGAAAFEEGGRIDWSHAEALAFASLLALGVPVRLTGQDTERGTFSQRHAVLHDANTGERWCPLQHLRDAVAPFELHNSPLSEQGCLGFEYGYSMQAPDALVLWEAQFGDFVNSAQVIVDQFMVSGLAKWGQTSRLTPAPAPRLRGLRARSTRALGSSAFCRPRPRETSGWPTATTPAQYFHLLRRQALVSKPRPLIVMTPEEPAAAPGRHLHAGRAGRGLVPARDRRPALRAARRRDAR